MDLNFFRLRHGTVCVIVAVTSLILLAQLARADPAHGIAMYGAPQLPSNFEALPYSNPDAPKGGRIVLSNPGTFTSLNPYNAKGTVPWQLRFLTHDSLMGRNQDEPFALYGLLAESIETPPDRSWVTFTLRPEARFSDGSPVTIDDVIWSYETLGTQGHGRYIGFWSQVKSIEQTGPRSVTLTFDSDNRELALIAGMRPILKKAQWAGKDFAAAGLDDVPIGAGPYVVDSFDAGRRVTLRRNPDYWARDLPFRRGTHNFDEIVIDFYADSVVTFEAFKAGEISAIREGNAETWVTQYDFPAVQRGDILQSEIGHQKPSGMTGFAINTRKPPLDDWRVRQALIEAYNFEYINETFTNGRESRISSYFSGSLLAFQPGPATDRVAALLAPFEADLPPGTLQGYAMPKSDGSARNRASIRRALRLLQEAGLTLQEGRLTRPDGTPVVLTLLLNASNRSDAAKADIYQQSLERLGITLVIDRVEAAQFNERSGEFDFDLVSYRRALSLSPGNEQYYYWGSASADTKGGRNLPGISNPAVDAMIDAMLSAPDQQRFVDAVRALDRVLTAGRYVIPFTRSDRARIAHVRQMKRPAYVPIYGDGPTYMPQQWWWDDSED